MRRGRRGEGRGGEEEERGTLVQFISAVMWRHS